MTDKRFFKHNNSVCDTDMKVPITLWENPEQQDKFCNELNGMQNTIDNLSNHLQKELQENVDLNNRKNIDIAILREENEKLKSERNYFERKKTEYLTKLNECKLENTDLINKYDTETEHLIKENVKLKQEFGDYKKNIRRIMDIKKELDDDKCKHSQ